MTTSNPLFPDLEQPFDEKAYDVAMGGANGETVRVPDLWPREVTEFPFEVEAPPVEALVAALFQQLGEDENREGLRETPARFAKAWRTWGEGYTLDPNDVIKTFEEADYDEMVIVKDIPIYSKCEHHLADIFGTATIAYIPRGRVLGLSKLSRIANIFARRLQVQERLTVQIADALFLSELNPKGVGVIVRARHMCMESRGICQQGHHTITSCLRGVLSTGEPRAEFLKLAS